MDKPIVEIRDLCHTYPDKTEVRVEGIPFVVYPGQSIALVGATGTGKTTLLKHIMGLLRPRAGWVRVFDRDPFQAFDRIRWQIGVVLQNPDEQIIGPTVFDDIAFGLRARRLPLQEIQQRVEAIAEELGITNLLDRVPHYLSGGQKQKVALAGALVPRPQLLVLDEPFSGLDAINKRELLAYISSYKRQWGLSVILSTHDLELVPAIAEQVYVLERGLLRMAGSPGEIFTRVTELQAAGLEPPAVIRLSSYLKELGILPEMPSSLQAYQDLLQKGVKLDSI